MVFSLLAFMIWQNSVNFRFLVSNGTKVLLGGENEVVKHYNTFHDIVRTADTNNSISQLLNYILAVNDCIKDVTSVNHF